MNMIDRVVGYFAPKAALSRARARSAMSQVMNYDAASKGRRTYGWKAPASAADAAAENVRAGLRQLSRDMVRNRPFAARARDVVAVNVVGTGIQWSVMHDDKDKRDQIAAVLRAHLDTPSIDARGECDLSEMQSIVMQAVFTDGEVLARRRIRRGTYARNLALPFQVELLEPDHLDTTLPSNGENEVIEGIEYGPAGDIEAYHLFPVHPGAAATTRGDLRSQRVSWRDVIHVRRFSRAGQLRGVPWLAPVMMTLGELSDYQEAQILKQRMAALMAGVIEWEEGASIPKEYKGLADLEPGAMVSVPAGGKIKFTEPPQVQGYDEFMRGGLRAVAMGIGLTYESVSGDLSGVNFSSGRMGRMEMDRNVEAWQQHLMIGQFCAGVARWTAESWALQKVLPTERFGMNWTAPRRPLIDPAKEIGASIDAIDAGLTSRGREQRRLGHDPDEIARERAEDLARDAAANLPAPARRPAPAVPATVIEETDE